MKNMLVWSSTALVVSTIAVAAIHAEERTCAGFIGRVTLDNLRVPSGATCTLSRTRLQGSIVVERGGTLQATGVRVNGNVQAEGARSVHLNGGSVVGGSVQVKQGYSAVVDASWINGDLQFESNAAALAATRTVVGGSIQVFGNAGGATISNNTVDGNLQCKENSPAPTGGGNVVQGNKEDQCRGL